MPNHSQRSQAYKIGNSLLVHHSRLYESNAGILIRDRQAYLIDPGILPDEIDAVTQTVAQADATLRAVVITHSHWDHILGPERFAGVPVIASALAAHALADEPRVGQLVVERLAANGAARTTPFAPPFIDIQIESHLALPFREGNLIFSTAPGHCADQIVVYETAEKILWAADMLSDIEIPFVEDCIAYRSTLERLMRLDIAILVPGHGTPTTNRVEIQARIASDHAYLQSLESDITAHLKLGNTLDQIRERLRTQPVRNPEINAKEHVRNIETVYASIASS